MTGAHSSLHLLRFSWRRPFTRQTATGRERRVRHGRLQATGRPRQESRPTTAATSEATNSTITSRAAAEHISSRSARRRRTTGERTSTTAARRRLRSSSGVVTPHAVSRAATLHPTKTQIMKASTSARTRPEATAVPPIPELRLATPTCVSSRERTRHATHTATSSSATIRMTAT